MSQDNVKESDGAAEINFDGLIGPTHHFAGLAPGNLASWLHRDQTSNPRAAAHQGLAKMQQLRSLGVPQAVVPPQPRPNTELLRRLGFSGDDATVLSKANREAPHLLAAASSGSSMWTANAATVCPSADARDGRVHFTPANLVTSLHRASETDVTARVLKAIFHDERFFVHHDALPSSTDMGDEGAANHSRFTDKFNDAGVQLFVFGSDRNARDHSTPARFAARQTRQACESVARLHRLDPKRVVFAKQNPVAIDAGVFHHDVIAVGHRQLLFCHDAAFAEPQRVYESVRKATRNQIRIVEVGSDRLRLQDAVSTYLFNSQIVTTGDHQTVLVAPDHCRRNADVKSLLDELVADGTFDSVTFVDVDQSMDNGGGPACLRLRVVLTDDQQAAIVQGVLLTDQLHRKLSNWIDRHYRETLSTRDLADPNLLTESRAALDELSGLLDLGSIYDFQR
jgi:succinylarginine dihydrolase